MKLITASIIPWNACLMHNRTRTQRQIILTGTTFFIFNPIPLISKGVRIIIAFISSVKRKVQIKRAYERYSKTDGFRVLIDRCWPRGIKKENLSLDIWLKGIAPSVELRKKFSHDKEWKFFQSSYKKELLKFSAQEEIKLLASIAKKKKLTLVYCTKDEEHNNAVVLKSMIEKQL